jgi:hypothetical protein
VFATCLVVWELTETLVLSGFRLALIAVGYLVVGRIVQGEPPSPDTFIWAIEQTASAVASIGVRTLTW